jgi:hypothetical protein
MSVGLPSGTLTVAPLAFAAASALGATVNEAPTISGDPEPGPGPKLTASPGDWTPAGATAGYDWLRCNASSGDIGETCVVVTPTGPDQGTFTSGGQNGPGTTPAPDTSLKFIDPFPVVRISGRSTRRRTTLTRVTVNAPRGAGIRVDCKGSGCPYHRKAIAVKLVRVGALQRSYRPGATIEIHVTRPRKIGRYTRVNTRRGTAPLRIDRCLMPGSTRPVRCPTA